MDKIHQWVWFEHRELSNWHTGTSLVSEDVEINKIL